MEAVLITLIECHNFFRRAIQLSFPGCMRSSLWQDQLAMPVVIVFPAEKRT